MTKREKRVKRKKIRIARQNCRNQLKERQSNVPKNICESEIGASILCNEDENQQVDQRVKAGTEKRKKKRAYCNNS